MSDGTVSINPGAGVLIDTDSLTVGSDTVNRQRVRLAGAAAAEVAEVKNAAPQMDAYGQVVRIPGPDGQTFGTIVTPEIGIIYISGKTRAQVGNIIYQSTVTPGTGVTLMAGVVSTKIYMLQTTVTTDTTSTLYFRTGTGTGAGLEGSSIWREYQRTKQQPLRPRWGCIFAARLAEKVFILTARLPARLG